VIVCNEREVYKSFRYDMIKTPRMYRAHTCSLIKGRATSHLERMIKWQGKKGHGDVEMLTCN
jgi:hypothetical protein